jgi:hypothetical protein
MPKAEVRADCQPFAEAIAAFLTAKGMTKIGFCEAVYGRDEKGRTKGSGNIYPIMNAVFPPGAGIIAKIREKTGLDLSELRARFDAQQTGAAPEPVKVTKHAKKAMTPVKAALQAFKAAGGEPVSPAPVERRQSNHALPPRLALTIDQDGRAHVTVNLVDVPAEEAIRLVQLLSSAGLIES